MTVVETFVVLVYLHFLVDWCFQSHWEAMNKSKDDRIRMTHCVKYMYGVWVPITFLGIFGVLGNNKPHFLTMILPPVILLWSHYWEDTYKPVIWWMRNIRKVPNLDTTEEVQAFLQTNLGFMLLIAVDQIIHITFLWPVAWLAHLER